MKKKSWDAIVEAVQKKRNLTLNDIAEKLKIEHSVVDSWLKLEKTPCIKCRCALLELLMDGTVSEWDA